MLSSTLTWRLRTDLDSLSLSSLHPLYTSPVNRPPLFWCNTRCHDLYGRPLGVISLQSMERVTHEDGTAGLEECREYIVGCMESVRRFLALQYAQRTARTGSQKIELDQIKTPHGSGEGKQQRLPPPLQMVIIFSLASSGMANLELELLPFLLDLLKNHFPGMVGAVYIQHFGWVHSGMWALAKRILPQQALARIFFPSNKELADHFDLGALPVALGGHLEVELTDETNDVMHKFARPHWNTRLARSNSRSELAKAIGDDVEDEREQNTEDAEIHSAPPSPRGVSGTSTPITGAASRTPRTLSRTGSFDSLVDEFHSLSNSPHLSRNATPRPSRPTTPHIEMGNYQFTMAHPQGGTDGTGHAPNASATLRLTPSAVHKLHHLQMTRGESRSRTSSDAAAWGGASVGTSASASPNMSRSASPERSRRRRTRTGQSMMTSSQTVPAGIRGRNVHFDSASGSSSNTDLMRGEPVRRIGSLRDFRLHLDDLAQADEGIAGATDSSHSNSDDDSEKSGKTGERTDAANAKASQQIEQPSRAKRFFSLWRRQRSTQASDQGKGNDEGQNTGGDGEEGDETITQGNIPNSETLVSLPPEPVPPDSPQLQVPDIQEPPLSEMTHMFSRRSRLYNSLPGHVSPYNSANPFYGYPAYPSTTDAAATSNDPRPRYQFRRRKRDLIRTLMYLFVLRLLALNRHVRTAFLVAYRSTMRAIAVGGMTIDEDVSHVQQYQRYERLRSASARFSSGTGERRGSQVSSVKQRPKPQPLVVLGFRKRYAVLIIIVAFSLLRREWRSRPHRT